MAEFMAIELLMFNSRCIVSYYADMAELADAPDLGSGVYDVQVQLLLSALFQLFVNTCLQGAVFVLSL